MITITNLSKNFDQRLLLKEVSLSIYPREKIGLTGPNGAGKTTLFSIILGDIEPSAGSVQIQKNIRIAHLPQEAHFHSTKTVIEEITSGDRHIQALFEEKHTLEDQNKAGTMRYGDILHELESLGIYELEHTAEKVLIGLGFKQEDFSRPITALSGGWQMRVLLAKLLTYQYDLLLLDEPTNYLDLPATLWLKDYLSKYKGTFIIISHDKIFLNDVTNYTIVLEDGLMAKTKGNYAQYEFFKEQRLRTLEKKKREIEKRRTQLERFTQRFHAQPNRAAAVRSKRKMIERLETVELPHEKKSIKEFEFPQAKDSGHAVCTLEHIKKSYSDKQVYQDLCIEITRGQKICLVGPNGAGKSTLLKMLAGVIEFDSGARKLGHRVEEGYFSQTRLDVLNPQRTVIDEVASAASGKVPALQVRSLLGIFNFHGDDVFKHIKILSGGEKSRVILAKLLVCPPNFILLDEPTTHLDIDGVEALTKAFKAYEGTLCFISHDLFFIKEVANSIIEISQGELKHYAGGLDYYVSKSDEAHLATGISDTEQKKEEKNKKTEKAQQRKPHSISEKAHKRLQEAKARLVQIKTTIKDLRKEKEELETESYVKARVISDPLKVRDQQLLKEYGQRLKWIQRRLRAIDSSVEQLAQERNTMNKA
ncbi:ABC-F family ATP-binding cassette domain-containing protein [Candidatus Omnitrophota bacterium]